MTTIGIELISHEDRVALAAQEAVFVLSARRRERRGIEVLVSGPREDRTVEMVKERLGPDVEVLWCGDIPRHVRPRPCRGFREIEPGCLQLRFVVRLGQSVAGVEIVEGDDTVVVLGMVCMSVAADSVEQMDHSYHVYLSRPLGERTVIDAFTRAPLGERNAALV